MGVEILMEAGEIMHEIQFLALNICKDQRIPKQPFSTWKKPMNRSPNCPKIVRHPFIIAHSELGNERHWNQCKWNSYCQERMRTLTEQLKIYSSYYLERPAISNRRRRNERKYLWQQFLLLNWCLQDPVYILSHLRSGTSPMSRSVSSSSMSFFG